jgi:hypothetical protein
MIAARFGLIALIPAMLNLTAVPGGGSISLQICGGDGKARSVQVPLGEGGDDDKQGLCCAKGCHSGNQRKRLADGAAR